MSVLTKPIGGSSSNTRAHCECSTKLTIAPSQEFYHVQQILKDWRASSFPFIGSFGFVVSVEQDCMYSSSSCPVKVSNVVVAYMQNLRRTALRLFRPWRSLIHGRHIESRIWLLQIKILTETLKHEFVMRESEHGQDGVPVPFVCIG